MRRGEPAEPACADIILTEVNAWAHELAGLHARIAPRFARPEPRRRALSYLQGLLSPTERKNGWQLAEYVGEDTPDGIQRLLSAAKWDADLVRDDLQSYVIEHLSDAQAVLVVDETSFPKQGLKSVGVQPQYCGTTGQVENCQVGVFVVYASPRGSTFLDRALYLPQSWSEDQPRRQEAGIPDAVDFATKCELAQQMLERVMATGIPFSWVAADTLYGSDHGLRSWLEGLHVPYILAVRSDEPVTLMTAQGIRSMAVQDVVQSCAEETWQRLSMGEGSKGPRAFDWACLPIMHQGRDDQQHWLLIRRCVSDPTKCTFYLVYGPIGTTVQEMVRVAGARWKIEEIFEAAKGEVGLDQYEVRLWTCWYRHVTLAMLAHAYLTVVRACVVLQDQSLSTETIMELLPLTVPEVRHLLWQVVWPFQPRLERVLAWSRWRRRHQARAKRVHTKRRLNRQIGKSQAGQPAHKKQKHPSPQHREKSKGCSTKPERESGSHLLAAIEYVTEGEYLLVSERQGKLSLQPDSTEWVAWFEQLPSFHFCGKHGRFTARKEKRGGKGEYWIAYRKHQNKLYKQYIGATAKQTPLLLEQIADLLQTRIAQC